MKKFLAIVLCLVMVLSLVACGSKTTEQKESTQGKSAVSSSEKVDSISNDTEVPVKEDTFEFYLTDEDSLDDIVETTSLHHARFFVDANEFNNSNDYMTFFVQLFSYAMAGEYEGELSEEDLEGIPTEEEMLELLKSPLVLADSSSYMLMNFETGFVTLVQDNNSEDTTNPFEGYNLDEISEEDLKAYLEETMTSSNSMIESDDPDVEEDKFETKIGKVYKYSGAPANKVIFEIEMTYEVSDLEEIVEDVNAEETSGHIVTVYGYGAIVFNEEDSFTGLFLTPDKDKGTTLLSARSLEIDESVEGVNDEDMYGDLFGDIEFDDSDWETDLEGVEEEIEGLEEKINEGIEKSGDFD